MLFYPSCGCTPGHAGLSDARFIFNGSLRFGGLSDAGRGALTLGCAKVLEDTALGPLLIMDAIDLFD